MSEQRNRGERIWKGDQQATVELHMFSLRVMLFMLHYSVDAKMVTEV